MLKKYGMEDCAPMSTPMTTNYKLSKDDDSPLVDATHYRSMIGALLYLTTTRPNIMQAVGMVGIFQSTPKQSHLLAIKRILRYLKGNSDFGLWYPKNSTLTVTAYNDADWAGSIDDWKSTSGNAFFLGDCLVSWLSKKQSSISLSTTECKYIAATDCCTQILWMKEALKDLDICTNQPITIYCDNTSAISLNKNPVMHSRTKHIPIKYHFLCEQAAEQNIVLEYISTKEQIADIFTKPIPREAFEHLCQNMGVISLSSLNLGGCLLSLEKWACVTVLTHSDRKDKNLNGKPAQRKPQRLRREVERSRNSEETTTTEEEAKEAVEGGNEESEASEIHKNIKAK
eukprot:PITA_31054